MNIWKQVQQQRAAKAVPVDPTRYLDAWELRWLAPYTNGQPRILVKDGRYLEQSEPVKTIYVYPRYIGLGFR
jgi:hypothetical protein